MKILLYGLNFPPELTGVGRYSGDMAAWLSEAGHEVRCVTAYPYYPQWRIAEGRPAWRYSSEKWQGVTVRRCPLWVPRKPSGKSRLLHLLSFALSSSVMLWREALRFRPDIVWTVEPTSLGLAPALVASRLAGARSWLHVQDLEFNAAFRLGMLPRRLEGMVERSYRLLVRRFDVTSTISRTMARVFTELTGREPLLCPNWVDTNALYPLGRPSAFRAQLGLPEDAVVVLYAGAMGEKQGIEGLVAVARRFAQTPPASGLDRQAVHFVFAGDGFLRPWLEAQARELANVTLLPVQPEERLNELLNLADIHFLPQRADTTGFAMPSKLGGMLASGRPVVAQAVLDSEVVSHVAGCGKVVPIGAVEEAALAIRALAAEPGLRHAAGAQARRTAETELDRETLLQRLADVMGELVGKPRLA